MSPGGTFHEWNGPAADFHGRDLPTPPAGSIEVWAVVPERATIVAGSTQRDIVDERLAQLAGFATARRRSGGGVVLVEPEHTVWLDVVVARGDPRVSDDVGRSFDWVGGVFAGALRAAGVGVVAHSGVGRWDELGRLVCFAGTGPGESFDPSGRKVLGLSQRRTREQVRFQSVAYRKVPLSATLAALSDDAFTALNDHAFSARSDDALPYDRAAVAAELERRTAPLGTERSVRWWHRHLAQALLTAPTP